MSQFNSETNGQDLCTYTDDMLGTNSTSYPLAQKSRAANEGNRIIWSWIFESYGGWLYDDRNLVDLPEATTNLVSAQSFYTLPTDSAALMGVSFLLGSVWTPLEPVTLEQIQDKGLSESQFLSTNATPIYYRPLANGFKIYPASNVTTSLGLKAYLSRDISIFTPSDTNKSPGFNQEFHEALTVFMALQYAKRKTLKVKDDLLLDWQSYEQRIKKHYSQRFQELFPSRITVADAVAENQ